jgi:arylamine N-acetyltransferase
MRASICLCSSKPPSPSRTSLLTRKARGKKREELRREGRKMKERRKGRESEAKQEERLPALKEAMQSTSPTRFRVKNL